MEYSDILGHVTDMRTFLLPQLIFQRPSDDLELVDNFLSLITKVLTNSDHDAFDKWGIICCLVNEYAPESKRMFGALRRHKFIGEPEESQQSVSRELCVKLRDLFKKLLVIVTDKKNLDLIEQPL